MAPLEIPTNTHLAREWNNIILGKSAINKRGYFSSGSPFKLIKLIQIQLNVSYSYVFFLWFIICKFNS